MTEVLDSAEQDHRGRTDRPSGVRRAVVAVALIVLLIVAISYGAIRAVLPDPDSSALTGASDANKLIGAWKSSSEAGGDAGLIALKPASEIDVLQHGCHLEGQWVATSTGLFVADLSTSSGDCRRGAVAAVEGAQRFAVDRGVVELLTLEGELVQRLTPAEDLSAWGDSLGPADLAGDAYDPGDAPPMPQGTVVPELAELVDTRWVPAAMPRTAFSRQTPFVTFSGDGRWEGADGCNGVGGSWSMNPADGDWLAISSPSSDIGCDNVEVASMVGAARSVGIDPEGQLVFFDEQGGMTGEFVQAGR